MIIRVHVLLSLWLLLPLSGQAAGLAWNPGPPAERRNATANWVIDTHTSWQGTADRSSAVSYPGRAYPAATDLGFFASSSDAPPPKTDRRRPTASPAFHTNADCGIATISAGTLLITGTLAASPAADPSRLGALPFGSTAMVSDEPAPATPPDDSDSPSGTLDIAGSDTLTLIQLASGMLGQGSQMTLGSHRGGWVNTNFLTQLAAAPDDGTILTLNPDHSLLELIDRQGRTNRASEPLPALNFNALTIVPEPATGLLAALGAAALLRRRRTTVPV